MSDNKLDTTDKKRVIVYKRPTLKGSKPSLQRCEDKVLLAMEAQLERLLSSATKRSLEPHEVEQIKIFSNILKDLKKEKGNQEVHQHLHVNQVMNNASDDELLKLVDIDE